MARSAKKPRRDTKPKAPAQVEPTTGKPAVEEEKAPANTDRERADVIDAP